jgi:hypothetical protein
MSTVLNLNMHPKYRAGIQARERAEHNAKVLSGPYGSSRSKHSEHTDTPLAEVITLVTNAPVVPNVPVVAETEPERMVRIRTSLEKIRAHMQYLQDETDKENRQKLQTENVYAFPQTK